MRLSEGCAPFLQYQTWYQRCEPDDADVTKAPLVVVHGGPGVPHDYLRSLTDIVNFGRTVIFYDQMGCGKSTHLPEADTALWTPGLFVDELDFLINHLEIDPGYHLLGQSWGGMLAQEHAIRGTRGLRSLVLSNTAASFSDFISSTDRLRAELPPEIQETLTRHEAAGDFAHPDYLEACQVFYRRHVLRLDEWPPDVARAFHLLEEDPTVYHAMNGPTEFHVIGSARNWSAKERLERIKTPTLIISGRYDEAGPEIQDALQEGITESRLEIFENSSHMPFWEERELYMAVVENFLASND